MYLKNSVSFKFLDFARAYLCCFGFSGPWRWFDESMLDCCEPLEKIKAEGTTFGSVVCLAQCAGAKVEEFHADQSTINDFRNHVIKCTNSEDCHLITSYDRKILEQVSF